MPMISELRGEQCRIVKGNTDAFAALFRLIPAVHERRHCSMRRNTDDGSSLTKLQPQQHLCGRLK